MARYYLQPWTRETWENPKNVTGETMRHTAGKNMGHIRPGDVIYTVAVFHGKLYLGNRMTVGMCVSRSEAQRILKTKDLWRAEHHFIATEDSRTEWNQNRQVPDEITSRLLMRRKDGIRGLKFRAPGLLDVQTLRQVSELDPRSAKLLDEFLASASAPVPPAPSVPEATDTALLDRYIKVIEDRRRFAAHLRHEWNVDLVRRKRELALARGDLRCAVCNFDYEHYFGEIYQKFIEFHHVVPLSILNSQTPTRLSDLVPVCFLCHEMLHGGEDQLSTNQVRELIRKAKQDIDEDHE